MKSKKHSPQQVIRKLGEAEAALASGKELAVVCQMLGVSTKTFYRWRKKYGGMKADEAKRLVALEEENKRLKKLVADLSLDNLIVKEALDIAKKL